MTLQYTVSSECWVSTIDPRWEQEIQSSKSIGTNGSSIPEDPVGPVPDGPVDPGEEEPGPLHAAHLHQAHQLTAIHSTLEMYSATVFVQACFCIVPYIY